MILNKRINIILILFLGLSFSLYTYCQSNNLTFQATLINTTTYHIAVTFNLQHKEVLYKDSLDFSIDSPYSTLSPWHSNREALAQYDEISKETKFVFDDQTTIILCAHCEPSCTPSRRQRAMAGRQEETFLYVTYQTNRHEYPQQELFQLPLPQKNQKQEKIELKKNEPSANTIQTRTIKNKPPTSQRTLQLFLLFIALMGIFFFLNQSSKKPIDRLAHVIRMLGWIGLGIGVGLICYMLLISYMLPLLA